MSHDLQPCTHQSSTALPLFGLQSFWVYGLNHLLTQKILRLLFFNCHSQQVFCLFQCLFVIECECAFMFPVHLCSRTVLMLLRQEMEKLPPHLADEFCNRVPHFMSKDGREEKKGRQCDYLLQSTVCEPCMTSPSEGAEYTEPFQQSSRTPLFIFVYGMMGNLTAAETN